MFFLVTTAAVIVWTIGFVVLLVYILQILRDIHAMVKRARKEIEHTGEIIEGVRNSLQEKGLGARHLVEFLIALLGRRKSRSRNKP